MAAEDEFAMGTSNRRKGGILGYIEDFVRRSVERNIGLSMYRIPNSSEVKVYMTTRATTFATMRKRER